MSEHEYTQSRRPARTRIGETSEKGKAFDFGGGTNRNFRDSANGIQEPAVGPRDILNLKVDLTVHKVVEFNCLTACECCSDVAMTESQTFKSAFTQDSWQLLISFHLLLCLEIEDDVLIHRTVITSSSLLSTRQLLFFIDMASEPSWQSKTINPPNVPAPQPQFSQVNTFEVRGPTKIVSVTGQLAIHLDGKSPPPEKFEDQVRMALQNLENCLGAAGASKRHIFKVTHYVVDFDFEKQNPANVFIEWLGIDHRPASVMMPVQRLAGPGWLYEIETWAIVPLDH